MSEWYDIQKKPSSNLRQLIKERLDKANPRRLLNDSVVDTITDWHSEAL
jgi:hypothetical protein